MLACLRAEGDVRKAEEMHTPTRQNALNLKTLFPSVVSSGKLTQTIIRPFTISLSLEGGCRAVRRSGGSGGGEMERSGEEWREVERDGRENGDMWWRWG